jgi:hypothetical protein
MHERTERAFCRLAFLVLCALPTLATVGFTLTTLTPWYHNAEIRQLENVLSQRLGVSVRIGGLQRPSPGAWQLEDVRLADPETKVEVARVRTVFYASVDGEVRLHLSQPEIQSTQFPLVWRVVHDRFLCQPDLLGTRLRLRAQDLSVISHPQGLTLSPVNVWIEPDDQQTNAGIRFSLVGSNPADEPATLSVSRVRDGDKPRTRWELRTGSSSLPCSVMADYLPVMRRLGIDAEFSGMLRWEVDREDYTVQLLGAKFKQVNMLDLFEPFDQQVSGRGTIEIQSLTRHSRRPISEATGKINITEGRIEVGLLRAMAQSLGAQLAPISHDDSDRLPYQIISLDFALHGNELRMAGGCSRQPNFESFETGTAMVADNRPVLAFDPAMRLSSAQLTSVIDPAGRIALPIGPERTWTHRYLPQLSESQEGKAGPQVRGVRLSPR